RERDGERGRVIGSITFCFSELPLPWRERAGERGGKYMTQTEEKALMRKMAWKVLPFLLVAYLICIIDRLNVGLAALTMNAELGFTATVYGWGAGLFFVGYFIGEVPSNIILSKVGARLWFARIMVTWGIFAIAMGFISGDVSFFVTRFLLGVAEAGFFPG